MDHLTGEVLARIADGPATEEETRHLAGCAACRAERDAVREMTAALASLPPPPVPGTLWPRVEAALPAAPPADAAPPAPARSTVRPLPARLARTWLPRAAAAALLFAGGWLAGARGGAPAPGPAAEPVPAAATAGDPALPDTDPAGELERAEARYLAALARWSEAAEASGAGDPTRRLAALEGVVHTTRAALEETPADPVIHGLYRAALAQREAILTDVHVTQAQAWF